MTIGKLSVSSYCDQTCSCGEGGKLVSKHLGDFSDSPFSFSNVISYLNDGKYIDWNETMKNICQRIGADMCIIGVCSSDILDVQYCVNRYHTVGCFGQEYAPEKCVSCETLSHDKSLSHFSVHRKCIVLSNDSASDPRCAYSEEMVDVNEGLKIKSVLCAPLILPNGECIGVFGCGCKEDKKWHRNDMAVKMISLLDHLAMVLQCDFSNRTVSVVNEKMKNVMNSTITEISESNRSRDTFIATMSHEIRTPLTSIVAVLQLLDSIEMRTSNESKIRKLYDVAKSSSGQLLELINDILDFCKLRSTKINLQEDKIDIVKMLDETIDMFESQTKRKEVELIKAKWAYPNRQVKVLGDAKRIRQVVLNLLSNSLKFTDVGGVINVELNIQERENEFEVKIIVKDNGVGVNTETMKHIFEPYFTAKRKDWTDVLNGVGLGLAISKELVDLMGGKLYIESDGMSGTQAYLILNMMKTNSLESVSFANSTSIPPNEPVIIIDDRIEHRLYMMKTTRKWGMIPNSFSSSTEALMALDVLGEGYRIALVDIDLSGGGKPSESNDTGVVFAQSIRRKGLSISLIAVSSVGSVFGGHQLFDVVMVKPISESQLFQAITNCLAGGGSGGSNTQRRSHSDVSSFSSSRSGVVQLPVAEHHLNVPKNINERSINIMVVDDDEQNAQLFKQIFVEALHYENVECVSSAVECLHKLEHSKNKPVLIFMDIIMPQTSGIDCVKRIRSDISRYGNPKVVALTADALDSTKFKCLNSGFDFFLSKPTTTEELKNAVQWMTHKQRFYSV